MITKKKIVLSVITVILAAVVIYGVYYIIRFATYNGYREYVTDYEYEESTGSFAAASDSSPTVDGMKLVAENDNLKLYTDTSTGYVAVYDKRNGETVYSNPLGADEDALANETNKNYLKSQLVVNYYNTSRVESTIDSYSACVALEQLECEAIDGGIRYLYTIGDRTASTGIVPIYISEETLNDVLSKLDEDGAKFVKKKFTESTVAEGYLELLESAQTGASQLRKLNKYFEEAGFTSEDYETEMLGSGVEGVVPIYFVVPLEYRLLDDSIEVSIPMKGVEEYGGGAIHTIQLLGFFGAGGKDEEGEILVPNGSGSIINFNNGKAKITSGNDYSEYIYGIDPMDAEYTVREVTDNPKIAMFGLFRENSGIFATIESGATIANVTANVAGEVNEYNNVYATFTFRGDDKLSMFGTTGSEADLPIVETNFYDIDVTVRYTMLAGDDASVSGAANYYRARLIDEGVFTQNDSQSDIKFYYDVLGGVERREFFLGTQYRGLFAMTTFDEAGDMAEDLSERGISNQVMNYQGWTNGGYYHDVFWRVHVPTKLGGRGRMELLSEKLAELGGTFYADVAFQKVSSVSSHYSSTYESSRYYGTGYVAEFGLVNPTTLRQTSSLGYEENIYYLISPKFLIKYTGKFAKAIEGYDISGVSLRDLGNELHSDKKRTNVIDREDSLEVVDSQLQLLDDTGKSLMMNSANDYAFKYADDIINAPLTDNDYYIIDETVPFYEMLIHGCIDYSGSVINLSDTTDADMIVLNHIEAGASPHFEFSWESRVSLRHRT